MDEYDASQIKVLSGMEAVRRRPGMYIGDTEDGTGLHHLLWEVIGTSVDEHREGNASYLRVAFHDDGAVTVEDDGRGIPIGALPHEPDISPPRGDDDPIARGLRMAFDARARRASPVERGAVVNALCARLEAEICRDGRRYVQSYAAGVALGPIRDLGPTDRSGTRITFTPDFSILRRRPWDRALVARRLRELAALQPPVNHHSRRPCLPLPGGPGRPRPVSGSWQRSLHGEPIDIRGARDDVGVDVALLWTGGARTRVRGFVGHARPCGGTHLRGLARGLFEAFVELDPARFGTVQRAAFDEVLSPGLVAAVHATLAHPCFGSPTRDQLENPEVLTAVSAVVAEQLAARLRDDQQLRETLLARMPR